MILFFIITIILFVHFVISLYNYFTAPVFISKINSGSSRLISILIPARNEESNISTSLESIAAQSYKNIEVYAGNDNSTDNTPEIIDKFAEFYAFIHKKNIPPLPEGWKGKTHALNTLSSSAKGEFILFIDADVKLEKDAVSSAYAYMEETGADVISVFPDQLMSGFGEKIIVPLLNFFLLTLLPLKQVYRSNKASLSAGIGQFMMFRRSAYEKIGEHQSVHDKIAEDLELIRLVKKNNLKVLTMLNGDLISCRMYSNFKEAFYGFSKNFYPGSSMNPVFFLITLFIYTSVFMLPFIMIFFNFIYLVPVILIAVIRILITKKSGQEFHTILLHPVQIPMMLLIGLYSVTAWKKVKWKGR